MDAGSSKGRDNRQHMLERLIKIEVFVHVKLIQVRRH